MEEQNKEQNSEKINKLIIPLSIIIAGAIIAGAIYFSGDKNVAPITDSSPNGNTDVNQQLPEEDTASLDNLSPISINDHVRGDRNAPVKVFEYSDTECPFCKRFHETMNQIMDEYGKDGKVAWVYRHFPLDQLHPVKARMEAVAFECANELGGNDKFWAYADRLFEVTPSNNGLDAAELPKIAQYVGLNVSKFNTCLVSGKYDKRIEDDSDNARATGGNGTPWSIVVAKNGKKFPLNGAQPYDSVKRLIDLALQEE